MSYIGLLPRTEFDSLIDALRSLGAQCIGPTVRDNAIVYAPLTSSTALPQGIHDQQAPGSYQLSNNNGSRWFAWANGPQALKPLLFAPEDRLWQVEREPDGGLNFQAQVPDVGLTAVIGVRACDLAAMTLQDQHFISGDNIDQAYATRRQDFIIIAVNCTHPAATCFCHATGDGPVASDHYDILLDELDEGFAVQSGSVRGEEIINKLVLQPLTTLHEQQIKAAHDTAIEQQTRGLPDTDLPTLLFNQQESNRWHVIGDKCLSCGNCTSVCPTCFCHHTIDDTTLDGKVTTRLRQWDSCFSQDHSYIHGFTLRPDSALRYRQWLTHKFASWVEQYGRSGCVGCGRCISWCPVEIDVTEELQLIAKEASHA
ncbi:MAG: 4Fe-4S dicluster domain-containing protein [Gammaproteobacteria bacterium]|nr:4Fe-4S dicluster domain-containing protein [Gammaproteobacteria bacterium]